MQGYGAGIGTCMPFIILVFLAMMGGISTSSRPAIEAQSRSPGSLQILEASRIPTNPSRNDAQASR
eukprot:9253374-Pyramimonas_sp.AAC.1